MMLQPSREEIREELEEQVNEEFESVKEEVREVLKSAKELVDEDSYEFHYPPTEEQINNAKAIFNFQDEPEVDVLKVLQQESKEEVITPKTEKKVAAIKYQNFFPELSDYKQAEYLIRANMVGPSYIQSKIDSKTTELEFMPSSVEIVAACLCSLSGGYIGAKIVENFKSIYSKFNAASA